MKTETDPIDRSLVSAFWRNEGSTFLFLGLSDSENVKCGDFDCQLA